MVSFLGKEISPDSSNKTGKDITQYVGDLVRLQIISDKVIGVEPLSRGTRESHFVESWVYAVSHEDEPDRKDCVRLKRTLAFVHRMRALSPHEEGKHIEVIRDLLTERPNTVQLLGSPYDEPTEGVIGGMIARLKGRRPEGSK